VASLVSTVLEPIKNLATGEVVAVDMLLPGGLEYKRGIVCEAVNRSSGPIPYDIARGHTTLAYVEQTHAGLKR
jgi:hypothetical protein